MNIRKIISILYQVLFFAVPLILYPYTSELFEFNKIVVIYIFTVLILFFWVIRCISEKKVVLKRTLLDAPILIFMASQTLSTLISLDIRTSLFGYYSRFNGGLLSLFSYFILYYGYVANMEKDDVFLSLRVIILTTLLSSIYGILEHFGIDKNVWIQDVQNRVFSTFGQPNWMAAWLVAVIPISLSLGLSSRTTNKIPNTKYQISKLNIQDLKTLLPYILTAVFFITLLFTKSRSGVLGFTIASISFWGISFGISYRNKTDLKKLIKQFAVYHLIFGILILVIGTPYSKNLSELYSGFQNSRSAASTPVVSNDKNQGPALEVGGSSSAEIRKIVWRGALDIWKNYPLFGSGVETFAYSYYQFRPASHNLVSEWDFLYNKAHNEYLNFMATTGTVGIISYLTLIISSIFLFLKQTIQKYEYRSTKWFSKLTILSKTEGQIPINKSHSIKQGNPEFIQIPDFGFRIFGVALLSGYLSILVTNFFGFSVVPVNLLFYLFPAMAVILGISNKQQAISNNILDSGQKFLVIIFSLIACVLLIFISRYWYADILYNKADGFGKAGNLLDSVKAANAAIKLVPGEAVYHDELASELTDIATVYKSQNNENGAKRFSDNAFKEINLAEDLSPNNLNIIRNKARIAIKLSDIDPVYILDAKKALLKGIEMAPTEAKLYYNLSLTYYRIGDTEKTIETLKKTIDLKPNYKDARYAYAIILSEKGDIEEAKKQLRYILDKIEPGDVNAEKALKEMNGSAE